MPIASGRKLAQALADQSRRESSPGQPVNSLGIHAFESLEPPANGLASLRSALFGDADGGDEGRAAKHAAAFLPLRGEEVGSFVDDLVGAKQAGLPRSMLYGALKVAQWGSDLGGQGTARDQRRKPAALGSRGANRRACAAVSSYGGPLREDAQFLAMRERHFADPETAALRAWQFTHLWDYADALDLTSLAQADNAKAA
jgi:hypothetical protein